MFGKATHIWCCFKCHGEFCAESEEELQTLGHAHIWEHEQSAAAKALLACEVNERMSDREVVEFDKDFLVSCGVRPER